MQQRISFILRRFTFCRLFQLFVNPAVIRPEFNGPVSLSRILRTWRHSGLIPRPGPQVFFAVRLLRSSNDKCVNEILVKDC